MLQIKFIIDEVICQLYLQTLLVQPLAIFYYIKMQVQSNDSSNTQNLSSPIKIRKITKIKIFILGGLCLTYIIYRIFLKINQNDCIIDQYQKWTNPLNRLFVQSQGSAYEGNSNHLSIGGKIFIGIGQILMDVWIGFVGLIWLFKTSNMRSFFAMGLFYLVRGVIYLSLQKFPFPDNMAWRNPGFFSFVVPYQHTRDFFYSGHTGGIVIVTMEAFKLDLRKIGILALISTLYMANMLVVTKVHYVIDVIGGFIFGIWSYRQSIRYVMYFDKFLSLPYVLFLKLKSRFFSDQDNSVVVSLELASNTNKSNQPKQSQKPLVIRKGQSADPVDAQIVQRPQHFHILIDEINDQEL